VKAIVVSFVKGSRSLWSASVAAQAAPKAIGDLDAVVRDPQRPAPNRGPSSGRCRYRAWGRGRSATLKTPHRVSNFGQDRQALAKGGRLDRAWVPWGRAMQDIIRQKNLEHFRSLLRKTSQREERLLLLMLLAEEQMKEPRPQKVANDD
jgi:hypothetical protein